MDRFFAGNVCVFLFASLIFPATSSAQTLIHNQMVSTPNGRVQGLFEVTDGVLVQIPTGLTNNLFPSASFDGRYILISAADPLFPNDPSGDLFVFDRAIVQTQKVINNETTTQPNGSIFFSTPLFSALSPNNQLVALATQLGSVPDSGGGNPRTLKIHRASDGFDLGLVELGRGNQTDFFQSEFLGISWSPNGAIFASPAYVNVITNQGRATQAAGIVLFGFDPGSNSYRRVGQVTQPQVFDAPGPVIIAETHALPVFSPDGQRMAFFSITYPDPFLAQPATAELFTVNADGSNRTSLLRFNPGFYPAGLSWTPDGSQLVFSIGEQVREGIGFGPRPDLNTAVLRFINATGGTPGPIPGAPLGWFPNVVFEGLAFPGDFNGDGRVDAADYIVWRKNDGTQAGYDLWRANFGRTAASGTSAAGSAGAAAPEPISLLLLAAGVILALSAGRGRGH